MYVKQVNHDQLLPGYEEHVHSFLKKHRLLA